jgi:hypothetical protein
LPDNVIKSCYKLLYSEFSLIGLALIALGTGGIKPCVAAFGGDQFKLPDQERQLQVNGSCKNLYRLQSKAEVLTLHGVAEHEKVSLLFTFRPILASNS